jgi:[amino group carrier protein]-L-2-aminoadipate 6-kinase
MSDIMVVKCGGSVARDVRAISEDIALIVTAGTPVIVVHGGSADIESLRIRLDLPDRRLIAPDGVSTRYTDAATLELVSLALCGLTKPRLVTALNAAGLRAVGLSGLDGGVLRARRKLVHRAVVAGRTVLVRDNHAGRITTVDRDLLLGLVRAGFVPVLSPPAIAEDGRPVNVDADRAAAAVAAAVGASTLLMLTGAPGLLRDPADESSTVPSLAIDSAALPDFAGGGMRMKLVAAREALDQGVGRVVIGDGRVAAPAQQALTGQGSTTVLMAESNVRMEVSR